MERRWKSARPIARMRQGEVDWFKFNKTSVDVTDVYIYDEIGWFGITAQQFADELKQVSAKTLNVFINSPGGDVFDGLAILNALRRHDATVNVTIDGIAASAAAFIAMAGDTVTMGRNSQIMIHDAWGMGIGPADEMRKLAEELDFQSNNIAVVYAERAGGTAAEWRERMRAETWYTAQEAVDAGLADEVMQPKRKTGDQGNEVPDRSDQWDLSIFRHSGREAAPGPTRATAVGPHESSSKEGMWDKGTNEGRLPSPVPLATARKFYAWYDEDQVEDGAIPKSAGKLPHHFVSEDGTPGAASLNGVRNALARLPQTQGLSDAERSTIERHLRGHLPADDKEGRADSPATDQVPTLEPPSHEPEPAPPPAGEEPVPDPWAAAVTHLTNADGGWAAATQHLLKKGA